MFSPPVSTFTVGSQSSSSFTHPASSESVSGCKVLDFSVHVHVVIVSLTICRKLNSVSNYRTSNAENFIHI